MINPLKKLDANGNPIDESTVVPPAPAEDSVRDQALGRLKDQMLATVAPPKPEDPIFKLKRLMRAGVPSPLQTALGQQVQAAPGKVV